VVFAAVPELRDTYRQLQSWHLRSMRGYRLKNNWSMYAQWATGNVIPPSSVFDVKNAAVALTPKPTKTQAVQFGSCSRPIALLSTRLLRNPCGECIFVGSRHHREPVTTPPRHPHKDLRWKAMRLWQRFFVYGNASIGSASTPIPGCGSPVRLTIQKPPV